MYDMTTIAQKLTAADKTPMTITEHLLIDEIRLLRAQVEELTADAIERANKQAILIDALRRIVEGSFDPYIRGIASKVLTAIGELQP